ncbi:MAG: CvpA family protein [Dysosmobacter welbionis]
MTTPVIIDVIMAVVLIAAVIYGAHRGLFRALAGLAVVIVALVGAAIIANTLAAPAARLVTPLIREQIETKVDEAMARQSQEVQMPEEDVDEGFAIEDLLALMGLDEDVRNSLASQTQEKIQDTGVSLVMAVVESLAQSILYAALSWSPRGLTILLKLLIRAMDLVLQLPGLHLVNSLGGAVIGLIEGALVLFLAIWVLRRFGVSFETDTVSATHILRFFATHTPLSALSLLQ